MIQTGGSEFTAPHFHSQRPHLPQQYPNLRLVNPAPHLASSPQAPGSAEPQLGVLRTSPPPNKQPKALDCCQNYSSLSRTECACQPSPNQPLGSRGSAFAPPNKPLSEQAAAGSGLLSELQLSRAQSAPASPLNKPPGSRGSVLAPPNKPLSQPATSFQPFAPSPPTHSSTRATINTDTLTHQPTEFINPFLVL